MNERQCRRVDIGTVESVGAMAFGGLLFLTGAFKRGFPGAAFKVAGALLMIRGAQGYEPLYKAMGLKFDPQPLSPGRDARRAEAFVDVQKSPAELYALWRKLENLPAYMHNLLSVREIDATTSHWVAKGPAGTVANWEAKIINDVPGEKIAWQSVRGATVDNSGTVLFEPLGDGLTRVRVVLRYGLPALGNAVATLLHDDPQSQIEEDLCRFKAIVEVGVNQESRPELI